MSLNLNRRWRWAAADEGRQARQRLFDLVQEAGHVGFLEYAVKGDALAGTPGLPLLLCAPEPVTLACLQDWHALVDATDLPVVRRLLSEAVAQRADRASFDDRVQRLEDDDADLGEPVRRLSCRLLLRYGPDGQPEHASGTTVDATEQKEARLRYQRQAAQDQTARQQAEAANRAKEEFLTMLILRPLRPLRHFDKHKERTAAAMGVGLMRLYNKVKGYEATRAAAAQDK